MEAIDRIAAHIGAVTLGTLLAACLIGAGGSQARVGAQELGAEATTAPAQSCTTSGCHAEVTQHKRVHRPVAAGRCDMCHEPAAGATAFQPGARHEFKRAADKPSLCYACHDRLAEQAYVHEPVRMGLCVLCHDPHGAERAFFLRVDTDRELCAQCHGQTFDQGDHIHGPVSVGACGACHDPHQSSNRFRLRGEGTRQCGMCHLADMPGILATARVHAPVAEECGNCHEPHNSPNPFRLTSPPPRLCLDCHESIAKQLAHAEAVHKPVMEGRCGDCHEHHGGDFRRLLCDDFTPELYESFALGQYDLCYRCHRRAQVTEAVTTEATNFRNGDVNLHFKHVNREQKGRTCRVCHQIHASSNPKLIAETTPFGTWQLPLNFRKTQTGGSCLPGCHRRRGYDRVNAVQNE